MQEKEIEEGVSLGEIFRVIFRRVWLVVAITLSIAAVAVLSVAFFVNGLTQEYYMEYTLEFPGYENLRYPDGTAYRYQNIVSLQSLETVKQSDSLFTDIDVQKMYEENDVSIKLEETSTLKTSGVYSISVKGSYFKNSDIATRFIRKLALTPIDYITDVVNNATYDFYLDSYNSAETYEEKVAFLADQREYLLDKYSELMVTYGESYRYEGRTLKAYYSEISLVFGENTESLLNAELKAKGYVFNAETYRAEAEVKKLAINTEITENEKIIAELKALTEDNSEAKSKRIVTLTETNAELKAQIAAIDATLAKLEEADEAYTAGNAEFAGRLTKYYNDLTALTDTFKEVYSFIYEKESDIRFESSNAEVKGTTNLIIAAVGGLLGGFLIACVVVCIMDMPAYLKKRREEGSSASPSQPQEE